MDRNKFDDFRIGDEVEYQAWLFSEGAAGDSCNELLEVSLQATGVDGIVKSNATAKLMALVQAAQGCWLQFVGLAAKQFEDVPTTQCWLRGRIASSNIAANIRVDDMF